jgi:hypothetical protein
MEGRFWCPPARRKLRAAAPERVSCPRTSARFRRRCRAVAFGGLRRARAPGLALRAQVQPTGPSARCRIRNVAAHAASAASRAGVGGVDTGVARPPSRRRRPRPRRGDAPHPAQPAVERELADRGVCVERATAEAAATQRGARSAIGKSKPEPSLRSSAGARLTVIRRREAQLGGGDAERRRSRCSCMARSASPTIAKPGMPSRRAPRRRPRRARGRRALA